MAGSNISKKNTSKIEKGKDKLKKGLITVALATSLVGVLQSCQSKTELYGKGTPTEQEVVKSLKDSFLISYNTLWQKNKANGHNISQGPIIIKRGGNYSILLGHQHGVGRTNICQLYDNGEIGFSYDFDGLGGGIIYEQKNDGMKSIGEANRYQEIYKQLLGIFHEANGK